jgi:hypothetical protein
MAGKNAPVLTVRASYAKAPASERGAAPAMLRVDEAGRAVSKVERERELR